MTNVQQMEMRRNGKNPLVQDSKGPGESGHPRSSRPERGRPVPRGQVSPYGPAAQPVAEDAEEHESG
ncbi:hypothetical protein [Micromonospora echinofusca]|uniref:Uncharacterized protein n=1 Tax=Micromonospora echinofusca TaxID=47858 RepID=A0ABS3VKN2_MICEH|nr:hypothetical protein [Micromonospora echinofusca]MBO4205041.1 hypothetical protein [Micromonospora echinofusca]